MTRPALPVRFAMIGAGGVSRLHRNAFVQQPDLVQLVAVCDAREELARAYAEPLSPPAAVSTNYHDVLDPSAIDAAVIALPHYLHFPVAKDFVEVGIPVLVEKPLTCTLDETRELRDLARKHDVPVVAAQMRRFNPEAVWLNRWVRESPTNFGELRSFDIHSWQNILAYLHGVLGLPTGADHWLLDGERAGGGVVISLAVHQIDLIRFITGQDYVEVMAHGRFDSPFYNGAESSAAVLVRMDNEAAGTLHANYLTPRTPYNEAMHLFGEHGMIIQHVDAIGQYHGPLRFATNAGPVMREWNQHYENIESVPTVEVSELHEDPFVNQLAALACALHEGRRPANHIDENFNTIACIQAINDSFKSGQPEPVAKS